LGDFRHLTLDFGRREGTLKEALIAKGYIRSFN